MKVLAAAFGHNSIEIRNQVQSREEAIALAGRLLVASNRASELYVQSMLQAIEKFGPYIVIAPGIALAHGKPDSSVIQTGLSLLLLRQPIDFKHSQNDPVSLVFGLAAKDHESHLSLMAQLAEFLADEHNVKSLIESRDVDAIRCLLG
jgi:PTS system ascorbate-specific IIA component